MPAAEPFVPSFVPPQIRVQYVKLFPALTADHPNITHVHQNAFTQNSTVELITAHLIRFSRTSAGFICTRHFLPEAVRNVLYFTGSTRPSSKSRF